MDKNYTVGPLLSICNLDWRDILNEYFVLLL